MSEGIRNQIDTLLRSSALTFVGTIAEMGIAFFGKLIVARVLGVASYGAVSVGTKTISLLSIITLLGMHSGVGRYLPRYDDPSARRGVIWSAYQVAIPTSFVAGFFVILVAEPLALEVFHDPQVKPILWLAGVTIPFATVMRLSFGGLQGAEVTVPKVAVQNFLLPIVRLLGIGLALWLGLGALGYAGAYSVAWIVGGLFAFYYAVKHTPLFDDVEPTPMHRELLTFSVPVAVTAVMAMILSDIDTYMLGYYGGTGPVGVYNVIYPLSELLLVVLTSFSYLFMPLISTLHSEQETEKVKRLYQLVTKWIFVATVPIFLVVALFPEQAIGITFGEKYTGGSSALTVLSFGFLVHTVLGLNSNTLTSIGETRIIMFDNVSTAVLNVALNLLLIPQHGVLGAAVATAVSYIFLNLLYSAQLYRRTGIHPFTAAFVKPLVAATALVFATRQIIVTFLEVTPVVLVVMLVVFLLAYGLVVVRAGIIEEEEIEILLDMEDRLGVDLTPLKRIVSKLSKDL